MRLGLAQLNTTVGDLAGNRHKILDAYAALVAQGAELVVYPELAVCGYPPRDRKMRCRSGAPGPTFWVCLSAYASRSPGAVKTRTADGCRLTNTA